MDLTDFLAIIILLITIGITYLEFKNKKIPELFTSISISVIIFGASLYHIISTSFSNTVATYAYIGALIVGAIDIYVYVRNYSKTKRKIDEKTAEEDKTTNDN